MSTNKWGDMAESAPMPVACAPCPSAAINVRQYMPDIPDWILAPAVTFLAAALLLMMFQPPFVQVKSPSEPLAVEGTSVVRILVWSALAAGLVIAMPILLVVFGMK